MKVVKEKRSSMQFSGNDTSGNTSTSTAMTTLNFDPTDADHVIPVTIRVETAKKSNSTDDAEQDKPEPLPEVSIGWT